MPRPEQFGFFYQKGKLSGIFIYVFDPQLVESVDVKLWIRRANKQSKDAYFTHEHCQSSAYLLSVMVIHSGNGKLTSLTW